jgi:hypothetical protein
VELLAGDEWVVALERVAAVATRQHGCDERDLGVAERRERARSVERKVAIERRAVVERNASGEDQVEQQSRHQLGTRLRLRNALQQRGRGTNESAPEKESA